MGEREYLRWVLPDEEAQVLDGFARLHAASADTLPLEQGEGRLIGMFRAHGLLAPVWELPAGTGADPLDEAMVAVRERLVTQMASPEPLTAAERAARSGLANRQLTIR
jgi:hypothetical protein